MRVHAGIICVLMGQILAAQRVGVPTDELTNVDVEELFAVQVTSVGRKAQQLSKAPAAVFVVTAEDIRRSGATSIPEALRFVPGLTVLRVDGRSWVNSARGAARLYANKMLVMIDGRSLYTALFSGVIWDTVDVLLEDIERIEVVRGPGAVMWGPNAVNGVINIITKSARATKRGLATAAAGNELRAGSSVRWGDTPDDRFGYRIWGKYEDRSPGFSSTGHYFLDGSLFHRVPEVDYLDSSAARLGFRFDGEFNRRDRWMLQGNLFRAGRQEELGYMTLIPSEVDHVRGDTDYNGGAVQGSWTRTLSEGNENTLQFSYDKLAVEYPFTGGDANNFVIDYQKRRQTGETNELYWGVGFNQYWDRMRTKRAIGFVPGEGAYRSGNAVVRDEFQLAPGRLLVSAGLRVDYNSYTRFEYQPSLRLLYTPNSRQSAWIAASRAVRTPSRFDRDLESYGGVQFTAGIPFHVAAVGSHAMRSEVVRTFEGGYRLQSGQRWSVDASVFWSRYSRLRALRAPSTPVVRENDGVPSLWLLVVEENAAMGRSYGGEVWAIAQARPKWRLIPSYSYLDESQWVPNAPAGAYQWDAYPASLRHQASLRSQHDLSPAWQADLMARARSRNANYGVPGTILLDARLSWRKPSAGELSVSIQNLADRRVLEAYSEPPTVAIPLRRTFVVKWVRTF